MLTAKDFCRYLTFVVFIFASLFLTNSAFADTNRGEVRANLEARHEKVIYGTEIDEFTYVEFMLAIVAGPEAVATYLQGLAAEIAHDTGVEVGADTIWKLINGQQDETIVGGKTVYAGVVTYRNWSRVVIIEDEWEYELPLPNTHQFYVAIGKKEIPEDLNVSYVQRDKVQAAQLIGSTFKGKAAIANLGSRLFVIADPQQGENESLRLLAISLDDGASSPLSGSTFSGNVAMASVRQNLFVIGDDPNADSKMSLFRIDVQDNGSSQVLEEAKNKFWGDVSMTGVDDKLFVIANPDENGKKSLFRIDLQSNGTLHLLQNSTFTGRVAMASVGKELYVIGDEGPDGASVFWIDLNDKGKAYPLKGSTFKGGFGLATVQSTLYAIGDPDEQGQMPLWRVDLTSGKSKRISGATFSGNVAMTSIGGSLYVVGDTDPNTGESKLFRVLIHE